MRLRSVGLALLLLVGCQAEHSALPTEVGGRWEVQQIAGASLGEGVDIWLEIDAATGAVNGFTGCNNFSASMTAFGNMLGAGAVAEQDGPCPSEAAAIDERRFLSVWPGVQRYVRRGLSLELLAAPQGSETLLRLRLDAQSGEQNGS